MLEPGGLQVKQCEKPGFLNKTKKLRKTLARSSFVLEGSVHTEALSANAFRNCKRQCSRTLVMDYSLVALCIALTKALI